MKGTKKKAPKEPEQEVEVVREVAIEQPIIRPEEARKIKPWTRSQIDLIKRTIAVGATDDELLMFRSVCHSIQLNPFTKQIYFVKRWDSKEGKEKGAIQIGIDGFRVVAERTGAYAGNDDPQFEGELELSYSSGKGDAAQYIAPERATVKVYKIVQGVRCEFAATARWKEYYPGDKQGYMWRAKPHVMLGKVAEALALRKAFPADLSGIYEAGELDRAEAPATKQAAIEDSFSKATRMIGGVKDPTALEDFKKKLAASKLYDKQQKKQLDEVIEKRLSELTTPTYDGSQEADQSEAI